MAGTDDLWGRQITAMIYDATQRTLDLEVAVTRSGERTLWRLRLTDADNVRIDRPGEDWDYTELTEVHLSEIGGRGHIEAVFWVEPNGLCATYSGLAIDQIG